MTSGWSGVKVSLSSSDFGGTLWKSFIKRAWLYRIQGLVKLQRLFSPDGWPDCVDPGEVEIQTEHENYFFFWNFSVISKPEQGVSQSWHQACGGDRGDIEQASLRWEMRVEFPNMPIYFRAVHENGAGFKMAQASCSRVIIFSESLDVYWTCSQPNLRPLALQ